MIYLSILKLGSSVLAFAFIHKVIDLEWLIGTPTKSKQTRYLTWRFKNILMAFLHSTVTWFGCVYCWTRNPSLLFDPFNVCDEYSSLLVAFSTGFMLYDSYDMWLMRHFDSKLPVEIMHHAIIGFYFVSLVLLHQHCGLAILALGTELSTTVLHTRTLMTCAELQRNSTFKFVKLLSFPVSLTRFIFSFIISYHFMRGYNFYSLVLNPLLLFPSAMFFIYYNVFVSYSLFKKDYLDCNR